MITSVEAGPCHGHPFSNDRWTVEQAKLLTDSLGAQRHDAHNATALVVGAGSLPYTFDRLNASEVVLLDWSQGVLDSIQTRVELLKDCEDWPEYTARLSQSLEEIQKKRFEYELKYATRAGLLGDFALVHAGATRTRLTSRRGDIIHELPQLGRDIRAAQRVINFANFTNVGSWLETNGEQNLFEGHRALAALATTLPWSDEAVVVESGPGALRATVRTAEDFFAYYEE